MRSIATGLLTLSLLTPGWLWADDYGMVMDLEGDLEIQRGSERVPGDLGEPINVGDRLLLANNARATVVSYLDCKELILNGPGEVEVTWDALKVDQQDMVSEGRVLPVCYSREELNASDSGIIGGLVLRGVASDPVHELRQEFDKGGASVGTLMTLVMHDLATGELDRARVYFDALKQQKPNSAFVERMSSRFDTASTESAAGEAAPAQ